MTRFEIILSLLRIPLDFLSVLLSAVLAYHLRPLTDLIPFVHIPFYTNYLMPWDHFIEFSWWASLMFVIIVAINGLYNFVSTQGRFWELFKIIFSVVFLILAIVSFYALAKVETFFSRGVLLMMAIFITTFSFSFRIILRLVEKFLLQKGYGVRQIAIWGDSKLRQQLITEVHKTPYFKIIYHADDFNEDNINPANLHEVWFIKTEHNSDGRELLEFAQVNHLLYRFVPDVFGTLHAKVEEGTLGIFPLLTVHPTPLEGWGRVGKRSFDIVSASIGLLLLSPLFLVIAILIKTDSPGPVFYVSKRVGKNSRLFDMYKFRSMVSNADDLKEKLQAKNHRQNSPLFKIKNDPRITKLGKFLRRSSIDELPQLFNVLWGNMSLVGPRAHLPNEVAKYSLDQKRVLTIKPGITGLAQISGRSDLDFSEEIRLDLHYIVQWSILLDFKIIWKTVFVLWEGKGAD